jgi:hypothetical protein
MEIKQYVEWLQSESLKCVNTWNTERMQDLTTSADTLNEYLDTIIDNK